MVPYYQNWHEHQVIRLKGSNLAGQQQWQLLSSTRETSIDSIQQFDNITFHVALKFWPRSYYKIDLCHGICNCLDFPRVQYCKHLTAISVHFPYLCTQDKSPRDPIFWVASKSPEHVHNPEVCWASSTQGSLQKLMEDINLLSQELNDKIKNLAWELDLIVIKAIHLIKHTLTAVHASTWGA